MQLGFTQLGPSTNPSNLVAISPHLDDVVLGCADLVGAHPGALVVTVTAGTPPPHPLTGWDLACGFAEGDDVVGARRLEDREALERLGAQPMWLEFLDRQYVGGRSASPVAVAGALEEVLRSKRCEMVASPLGLQHPDHLATAAACLEVARRVASLRWIIYEDAIYRADDGLTEDAAARLVEEGFAMERLDVAATDRKRAAIGCYTSQLKGLGDLVSDAYRPERYWSLVRQR